MKLISFTKMVASGNDFVVITGEKDNDFRILPETVKTICSRKYGIGADGLMVLKNISTQIPDVEFYNSDGSYGALCGNGSRCIIKYIDEHFNGEKDVIRFVFNGKNYNGYVDNEGRAVFYLQEPAEININKKVELNGKTICGDFIDVNTPHFVIYIDESPGFFGKEPALEEINIFNIGRQIRHAGEFQPDGTNVNFVRVKSNRISIRTYERGVEDETLSCGTGSVSVTISAFLRGEVKPPVEILTRSGESLIVDFNYDNKTFNKLRLIGSAKKVFTGEFILN